MWQITITSHRTTALNTARYFLTSIETDSLSDNLINANVVIILIEVGIANFIITYPNIVVESSSLNQKKKEIGHDHPNNMILKEVEDIFVGMGYEVVSGPEVEYDLRSLREYGN